MLTIFDGIYIIGVNENRPDDPRVCMYVCMRRGACKNTLQKASPGWGGFVGRGDRLKCVNVNDKLATNFAATLPGFRTGSDHPHRLLPVHSRNSEP